MKRGHGHCNLVVMFLRSSRSALSTIRNLKTCTKYYVLHIIHEQSSKLCFICLQHGRQHHENALCSHKSDNNLFSHFAYTCCKQPYREPNKKRMRQIIGAGIHTTLSGISYEKKPEHT
jgi:hypothetical protein